jgi:circadian clock protein KaiC
VSLDLREAARLTAIPARSPSETGRVATGVGALDDVIGGGLPAGRSLLVCGPAGTGKTTLALQFLAAGIQAGERGMLALVDQKPRHVIEDARGLGWDIERWINDKTLRLLDASPYFTAAGKRQPPAAEIAGDLARQVRGFRAKRLVIDPITSLVANDQSPAGVREFLRTLIFAIEDNLGCTSVFTAPRGEGSAAACATAEQLVSAVVELGVTRSGDELVRRLTVQKVRGSEVGPTEIPVRIASGSGVVRV